MIDSKKVFETNCFKSIRKLMYVSCGFLAISGTGIVIKFQDKFYFCCLYHSVVDSNGKFEANKITDLGVFYKTYLEINPKEIDNPADVILFPNPEQFTKSFTADAIVDDLMLGEEFICIEIIGENNLKPIGYLDFDDENFKKYLFSEKLPRKDEILLVCGFNLSNNEIKYGNEGGIQTVYHEVGLYGGKCKQDEISFLIEKEDSNSSFEDCNGISGGIVIRMIGNQCEWVGIAARANGDFIRFIPYHLVAKTLVKNILDRA
ncbi:hypothetical protein [Neisseria dumasiana]|uniref:Peptidase S1 domain-containing protein n=1 Tax=Neisseria dumasiana TaxID=1931275 RepID=A0A1X3DJ03_9NEIS|nr:hypothetical protein [Neisseria dumasiana]OSI22413.1 hypothetical protein BV912_05435 [Neisseria dumasiana]